MELLTLAWRNLWRNKRRTLITATSVFFAVWFALIMRAFQLGSYELMVNNIVHAYSGYFQLHATGYWKEQVLNNGFTYNKALFRKLDSLPGISGYTVRIESFALASSGLQTRGIMVNGINPDDENSLTSLKKKLVSGAYLNPSDSGALVSERLAGYLKIGIGDSLVIIGQGFHGAGAAGVFPVKGIVRFPSPDLDGRLVFLNLETARTLFSADSIVTSIAFNVTDPVAYPKIARELKKKVDPSVYEVMTWEEMMPDVVQQIRADSASGLIMLGILYMIVGFGIFGTMLMMLNERMREFGMMIAVGMQKRQLMKILVAETFLLGILGIITGIIAAVIPIYYYHVHPIPLTGELAESTIRMGFEPSMPTAWTPDFFIAQSLIVLLIVMVVMILPVMRVKRLNVINAIRR